MSKETVSLETLHKIVPLYEDIKAVHEECTDKRCITCDFRRFGVDCQSMCIAVKLQDKLCSSAKTTLRAFVNYLLDMFYSDEAMTFEYGKVTEMIRKGVDKFIEEEL